MTMNGNPSTAQRDSRTTIVRIATFLGGIYFFLHFILPETILAQLGVVEAHESISTGFIVVGAMAIGLGIINLVVSHGSRVIFRRSDWFFSATLLVGLFMMMGVTCAQWLYERANSERVQRVRIIGDFADRIVEDAQAGRGHEKSFAPEGVIPPLTIRVEALTRYTNEIMRELETEDAIHVPTDPTFTALRQEMFQNLALLRATLYKVSARSWTQIDTEGAAQLKSLGAQALALGAAYSLLVRETTKGSRISYLYSLLYEGLFNNLGSAMFALLGVYIAAAAYRAFRIQSLEAALMMLAALVVMLGQISFGRHLYGDMPAVRQWLLEVPNSAAFRAIRLGAGVAGLMLAIRMWLSIEADSRHRGK